jgi:DNA-binding transcriptional MerR regulator
MSDLGNTPDTSAQKQREIARDAAAIKAGEQGLLFDDNAMEPLPEVGYRGPVAAGVVGITYRQLDYWARTSLVLPTVRPATGSGTSRLYGFRDILELKIVKRLLDTGVSLQQIRTAVEHLRARGTTDLTQVTLMSDGVSVYECTSPDEVIDLLAGGQGVFGIAIGRVWQEIEGSLSQLPSDQSEFAVSESDISDTAMGNDELSMRRRARVAGE